MPLVRGVWHWYGRNRENLAPLQPFATLPDCSAPAAVANLPVAALPKTKEGKTDETGHLALGPGDSGRLHVVDQATRPAEPSARELGFARRLRHSLQGAAYLSEGRRVTRRKGAGSGFHAAMFRAHSRACALSVTPGNRRRSSTAADSSPP